MTTGNGKVRDREMYKYTSGSYFSETEKVFISKLAMGSGFSDGIHMHDFIEIVYIFGGNGTHSINGVSYDVKKGDLLFINYGQTHEFSADKEGMMFYNILVRPEFFSRELINSENAFALLSLTAFEEFSVLVDRKNPFVSFPDEQMKRIEVLLTVMEEEFCGNRQGRKTMLNALMQVFMLSIFRAMSPGISRQQKSFSNIPGDLLQYIETHSNEKISLRDLADRCFYTPSYFSRLFKETYSMTITDFITKIRIEKSMELLRSTSMTVDEICAAVGYSDKTKFYKNFRELCSATPAQYRSRFSPHPVENH